MTDSTTPQDGKAMSPASPGSAEDRITAYLCSGGLFNPELAIHDRVRDLLIDARAVITSLRLTDAEREAVDTAEASLMRESTDLSTPLLVRQRLGAAAATLRGLLERMK